MRSVIASWLIWAVVASIILMAATARIYMMFPRIIYVRTRALDEGICDVMAANALAYYSNVKDYYKFREFFDDQVWFTIKHNPFFNVTYEVVHAEVISYRHRGVASISVIWHLYPAGIYIGIHATRIYFYVEFINVTQVVDPITGKASWNIVAWLYCELERPTIVESPDPEVKAHYWKENLWNVTAPAEYAVIRLNDWRKILVEVKL